MAERQLKLSIMGASGVGKSVFLASYFKYAMKDGEGKHSISLADSKSIDHVNDMIQSLFLDAKPIIGTDKRYDMSFRVDQDMTVNLHDIPGGWTTSPDGWENEAVRISEDLRQADGVIFFISIEDIIHAERHNEQAFKAVQSFSLALELLRRPKDGASPRQDVPICIVFTKGDLGPDITIEELESRYRAFLKNAQAGSTKMKWFKTGKNVKCWKSIAMGVWETVDQPPSQDKHENVVEPVEWLIDGMIAARSVHKKRLIGLLVVIFFVLSTAAVSFDHLRWWLTKTNITNHIKANQFSEAEKALDRFDKRWFTRAMLPSFLEAGKNLQSEWSDILASQETYLQQQLLNEANKHYVRLSSYVEGIDYTQYPQAELSYYAEAVEKILEYINRTDYHQVTPEKYEKMKQALSYWLICKDLRTLETGVVETPSDAETSLTNLEKYLKIMTEVPQIWQDRIHPKIHGLLLDWLNFHQTPDSPQSVNAWIKQGEKLKQYLAIPQDTSQVLTEHIQRWKEGEINLWRPVYEDWLREADGTSANDPEESIRFLNDKKTQNELPEQFRSGIDNKIRFYENKIIETKLNDLKLKANNARNLAELSMDILPDFDNFKRDHSEHIDKATPVIAETVQDLLDKENKSIETIFSNRLNSKDFDGARKVIDDYLASLKNSLGRLRDWIQDHSEKIQNLRVEYEKRLKDGEYIALKKSFNNLAMEKSPSAIQIDQVIQQIERFDKLYSAYQEASEVKIVREFLRTVKNGIRCDLIVQRSKCELKFTQRDKYQLQVDISAGGNFNKSQNQETDEGIYWNERIDMTWSPQTIIDIRLYQIPIWGSPNQRISRKIYANSLLGFRNLEDTVYGDGDCSVQIRSNINVPRLPADWN